jgi:hypothetical protein
LAPLAWGDDGFGAPQHRLSSAASARARGAARAFLS